MNSFYFNDYQLKDNKVYIEGEDFHHIKNVLRCKHNEQVYLCDEFSQRYLAKINNFLEDKVEIEILEKLDRSTENKVDITLFQGLPKQDKLELIIQKCTELGVNTVVPIVMERSIAKVDDKSVDKKTPC